MKFPRTPHLPGSKATPDDLWADFTPAGEYIATEKMDGSNVMINREGFVTRKGTSSSADWVWPARAIQQTVGHLIPQDTWLAGELLTWRKSISYEGLPGDFMVFGAIKGDAVLPWEEVVALAGSCGLPVVPVLHRGGFIEVVEAARAQMTEAQEGFVVRPTASFALSRYGEYVAKWVGAHHDPVARSRGRNGVVGS